MKKKICTLTTEVLERRLPGQPTEGGCFDHDVIVSLKAAKSSGSPRDYVNKEIARNLAHCIASTSVPQEYWIATFLPWAQAAFNFPPQMRMK